MRPALGRPLTALALTAALTGLTACSEEAALEPSAAATSDEASGATPAPSATAAPVVPSASAAPSRAAGAPVASAPAASAPAAGAQAPGAQAPGAQDSGAQAPAGAAPAAPAASAPAARAAAPASRATAAGTYTYDARGTVTLGAGAPQSRSGTATLRVDAPEGDRQSAVLQGDQGRTETDGVLRSDGRYLARLLLTTPAFSKEFAPTTPVLLLPEPLAVGRTWSFTLRSTDGATTASARNRVLRSEAVTVGGRRLDTQVVETRLSLRGDVVYDGTTTTHYAPSVRLGVRERGTGRGTVNGVPFSTDTSSTLRSTEPA